MLRPITTLHAQVVRLKDLFDDAGRNADRVLGPGPAPGGRIVVEARQLAAIARQFDVDWRPISSGGTGVSCCRVTDLRWLLRSPSPIGS